MELINTYWAIIAFIFGIIWKQISDHFTIQRLKEEVEELTKSHSTIKEDIQIIKMDTAIVRTILEERMNNQKNRQS